ncbi:MAG: hypothetical protein H6Q52_2194, partial [Deltaproteobacteria bacterium]|nr:hypothetical protein [Deltaproteobacteria bacterium]
FGIDLEANWIWIGRGTDQGTRYFSTPIYYSAVPIAPMEDVHVMSSIGGPDMVVDQASFTRKPSRLEKSGDVMIAEWHLDSFRVGQKEDVFFNVTMLGPVPEEERVISDSLQITYKDAAGVRIQREFGPCHIRVLPSSFISSISLADNIFAAGDNVIIGCSFNNLSNAEKKARLTAVIEDADGSVIKQVSQKDIQFPPGKDQRIENIVLNLASAIPGGHRARVVLSDGEGQLAEASAYFVVEDASFIRPVPEPANDLRRDRGIAQEEYRAQRDTEKNDFTDNPFVKKFEATIMAQPSPIYQGLSETIYYKISSTEGDVLAGLRVEVAILTPDTREKRQSFTPPVSHAKDGSCSGTLTFSTGKLEPGRYIVCLLVSSDVMAELQEIARTQFAVRRIDVVIT